MFLSLLRVTVLSSSLSVSVTCNSPISPLLPALAPVNWCVGAGWTQITREEFRLSNPRWSCVPLASPPFSSLFFLSLFSALFPSPRLSSLFILLFLPLPRSSRFFAPTSLLAIFLFLRRLNRFNGSHEFGCSRMSRKSNSFCISSTYRWKERSSILFRDVSVDSTQANKLFRSSYRCAERCTRSDKITFVFRSFLYDNSIRNDISELASDELSIGDSCCTNRFYDFNWLVIHYQIHLGNYDNFLTKLYQNVSRRIC